MGEESDRNYFVGRHRLRAKSARTECRSVDAGPIDAGRAELADPAADPEQPREHQRARRDQHHVLAAHGEDVVEPRGLEVLRRARRELRSRRRARSPRGPRAALPRGRGRSSARAARAAGRRGRRDRRARRPASTRRPCSTTWTPRRRSQVRSSNPCSGPAAACTTTSASRIGALRRRAAERQLELHRLARRAAAERPRPALGARIENCPAAGGAVTTTIAPARPADLRQEGAPVERVEPLARPPPAEQREHQPRAAPAARRRVDDAASADRRDEQTHTARPRAAVRRSRARARAQSDAASTCAGAAPAGQAGSPARGGSRSAPGRCRGSRRGRRPR